MIRQSHSKAFILSYIFQLRLNVHESYKPNVLGVGGKQDQTNLMFCKKKKDQKIYILSPLM